MGRIAELERKISEIAADEGHICHNSGYSPYEQSCPMCHKQVHYLSALNAARQSKSTR